MPNSGRESPTGMSDIDFVARLLVLPVAVVIDPVAPLVVLGWSLRFGLIRDPYLSGPAFAGFATDTFLTIVTLLYVTHVLAEKIILLSHALDILSLGLKPLAVAFLGLAYAHRLDSGSTLHWVCLATVIAGGVPAAFGLQLLRTKLRLGASVVTFGIAHPLISTAETGAGLLLAVLAIFQPLAALLLVVAVGVPVIWLSVLAVKALGTAVHALWHRTSAYRNQPT
jgi:hypothetical protein